MRALSAIALVSVGCAAALSSCWSSTSSDGDAESEILAGEIAYPFVDEARSLGRNGPEEKFVIKSAVGDREYTIEIPGAARDYDVQVPLGDLGETDGDVIAGRKPKQLASPVTTDKEMVAALPRLDKSRATDSALMDSAFGVGQTDGPKQSPSYTLGLAKVGDFYKRRQYEYALVEANNMLAFYPNSPQLHKMKGSILLKMRNLSLAELAWIRALELDPNDKVVRKALERLQKRIVQTGQSAASPTAATQPQQVPTPVGTLPPQKEDALAH